MAVGDDEAPGRTGRADATAATDETPQLAELLLLPLLLLRPPQCAVRSGQWAVGSGQPCGRADIRGRGPQAPCPCVPSSPLPVAHLSPCLFSLPRSPAPTVVCRATATGPRTGMGHGGMGHGGMGHGGTEMGAWQWAKERMELCVQTSRRRSCSLCRSWCTPATPATPATTATALFDIFSTTDYTVLLPNMLAMLWLDRIRKD